MMEVTVGESVTLSCNATSQSLPIYLRGEAVIDYTGWTIMNPPGNHVINPDNTQVTIATAVQGNNDATFNCQAKESGSSMSATISSTRMLKVSCEFLRIIIIIISLVVRLLKPTYKYNDKWSYVQCINVLHIFLCSHAPT